MSFRPISLLRPIIFITITLFMLQLSTGLLSAGDKAQTKFKIKTLKYYVPENRIQVETKVIDDAKVELVRCYFRAGVQENFVFIEMLSQGSSSFRGILPAPSAETNRLEYLFLAVNGNNEVSKTKTFMVTSREGADIPKWQDVGSVGKISLYTDLAEPPESVNGFTDSMTVDCVLSSARFGFVTGGIYTAAQVTEAGSAAGAAGSASTGTSSVSSGGLSSLSTGALVGIGAAVAGVTVGAIALTNENDECNEVCIQVREGEWDFYMYYRGTLFFGYGGTLSQDCCFVRFSYDPSFSGDLNGNQWSVHNTYDGYRFTGSFFGDPATSFSGTWTADSSGYSGDITGNYVQ